MWMYTHSHPPSHLSVLLSMIQTTFGCQGGCLSGGPAGMADTKSLGWQLLEAW